MSGPTELMSESRDQLLRGNLAAARQRIEAAAERWRAAGDTIEEVRCLRLAAALARHEGRYVEASADAARAAAKAPPGTVAAAQAHGERGNAALAAGDPEGAVAAFRTALSVPDLPGQLRSALEHRYAAALLAVDRPFAATEALDRGVQALAGAGDDAAARRARVDGVMLLQAYGQWEIADDLVVRAVAAVEAADDHEAVAELALLSAARAVERRDLQDARDSAQRARERALEGRSAPLYVASAIAMTELAEAAGDRVAAYTSLATGWVTLRDLVGPDGARAAFEPLLLAMRDRWGQAEFARVKAAYEVHRRGSTGHP